MGAGVSDWQAVLAGVLGHGVRVVAASCSFAMLLQGVPPTRASVQDPHPCVPHAPLTRGPPFWTAPPAQVLNITQLARALGCSWPYLVGGQDWSGPAVKCDGMRWV